jgi:hypothetical protein
MPRCFGSHYADASVIGVDIRDDYVSYARGRASLSAVPRFLYRPLIGFRTSTVAGYVL